MSQYYQDLIDNALLSTAAYATLDKNMSPQQIKDALIAGDLTGKFLLEPRFTASQADTFVARYSIVDIYSDSLTGAKMILFFDSVKGKNVIAIAGTQFENFNDDFESKGPGSIYATSVSLKCGIKGARLAGNQRGQAPMALP